MKRMYLMPAWMLGSSWVMSPTASSFPVAGMILLPVTAHLLEFIVHYQRGTERLGESIVLSVAFTALSTSFNLHAMRHGALTVGDGSQSLWQDLRRVPRLLLEFSRGIIREIRRFA